MRLICGAFKHALTSSLCGDRASTTGLATKQTGRRNAQRRGTAPDWNAVLSNMTSEAPSQSVQAPVAALRPPKLPAGRGGESGGRGVAGLAATTSAEHVASGEKAGTGLPKAGPRAASGAGGD